ncbi:MAG: SBBP repeat-containing protein [Acidobacteria bacterium]|nr:SBBP repeat-containing protein [Acidobacteriota bacterium]
MPGRIAPLLALSFAVSSPADSSLPVFFEPNQGQFPQQVRFSGKLGGIRLWLTDAGAWLRSGPDYIRLEWIGSQAHPKIQGAGALAGHSSYFKGPNPGAWRAGIPHYARVRCQSLYPGIDLVYYSSQGRLEFDLLVHPRADPSRIGLRIRGANNVRLGPSGELLMTLSRGELRLGKPAVYQPSSNGNRPVEAGFHMAGDGVVRFRISDYDKTQPLVIDPTLSSTYLGGRDVDIVSAAVRDSSGNIYITGYTSSTNFPLSGTPYKGVLTPGDADAFVLKLNPSASAILYATYLGGSFPDYGRAIAVDSAGAAFITGSTIGRFPVTPGAFRDLPADSPAIFVTKLDASGGTLVYSTYLDGAGAGLGIAVDSSGSAFVTGSTYTATFTTTAGAFQRTYAGMTDAFVVKLNATGTAQVYSTFLGGRSEDEATSIKVDSSGAAYVAGFTSSTDFPATTGAFRTANSGSTDAFVAKLNAAGSALIYSTYLGGSNTDRAYGIDVNAAGEAYVAGQTFSSPFPTTPGAFRTTHSGGGADAFVTKLNLSGTALVYSTFLGGNTACSILDPFRLYQCDAAYSIAVDSFGQAYVAGLAGGGFPLAAAGQSTPGGSGDAFVTQLNASGSLLMYSSYLGGSAGDVALAVAVSSAGAPVVTGFTNSSDFPVSTGVLQTAHGGGAQEGFLTLLAPCAVTLGSSGSFFPGTAASYAIDVFAPVSCSWAARSNVNWVTITSSGNSGNGQVGFTVATNSGPLRTGVIDVSGQTYTLQQVTNSCITLATSSSWHPQEGGQFQLAVFASCPWTATTTDAWITVVQGAGSGDGNVVYNVAPNATGVVRTGNIDVSGQLYEVKQISGTPSLSCLYTLSKTADGFGRFGGSSSLLITTAPGCEWSAASPSDWIKITAGVAGNGAGVVGYTVTINRSGQSRSGSVSIAGRVLQISQSSQ